MTLVWKRDKSELPRDLRGPLVIYHGGCPDGTCAAACALVAYPGAECVPASYGDSPPDVWGRDVIIVDFSYPRETLEEMAEHARSIRVLDHHKTAAADLDGFPGAIFDTGRSGAGLAWDELVGGPRPWIVNYVEGRDLWRYALPDSREVSAWLGTMLLDDPESWLRLLEDYENQEDPPDHVVSDGSVILAFQTQWCAQVAATAEYGVIASRHVPVVNAPHPLGSNVLELLYQGEPFAARWQRRKDGMYQYSLASADDGLDVSEIARQFGGGGHEHAAGFVSDRLVHLEESQPV